VRVPVVDLRVVRVLVQKRIMDVPVRVRLRALRACLVLVSVVLVVGVRVVVRQRLVRVFVLVPLAQVEPHRRQSLGLRRTHERRAVRVSRICAVVVSGEPAGPRWRLDDRDTSRP
jgi:hypothetical protein